MNPFRRRDDTHGLAVSMTGVKMGDRVAFVGCAHGGRLAAIAAKVGFSGRAVTIAPDQAAAERAGQGARRAGVLVEIEIAAPTRLPADNESFDLAVVDDTGGLLETMSGDNRVASVRELLRILRPGGRTIVIGAARPTGLGALLARGGGGAPSTADAAGATLQATGFKSVRTLAERDGLVFIEAIKPREGT